VTLPAGEDLTADMVNGQLWSILSLFSDSDSIATAETTTSATYTNLATVGPTVTITSRGTLAVVFIGSCQFTNNGGAVTASFAQYMSVKVSGATTLASSDSNSCRTTCNNLGAGFDTTRLMLLPINPGSNTFTAEYKHINGTQTALFKDRTIFVLAP
jgi:hypothetical protein